MKTYVECVCGGEAIALEVDGDTAYLAFWTSGHDSDHHTRWREKCRWIRQILRKGHPFCDNVVLEEDGLNRLIAALMAAREQVIAAKPLAASRGKGEGKP